MAKKRENPYQAVSIPKESLQKIKDHIEQFEYKSIADFIRIAIEDKIAVDTTDGAELYAADKKPTLENIQKQLLEVKQDIETLKQRKKKKIFML